MSIGSVINTNILSLNAQRNLAESQGQLGTSLERLSSGLRINSAKDDAAGLAISERFTAQINGQNQAIRNSNDGISFSQTAEGALDEVSNLLQRVRELAVQSANDTNSSSDREALNQEVDQAVAEIQRISEATQFNGQNVLDGSLEDLNFQVGANRGQTISVNGVNSQTDQLGAEVTEGSAVNTAALDTALSGTPLSINGEDIDLDNLSSVDDVVSAINDVSEDSGVSASRITSGDIVANTGLNDGELSAVTTGDAVFTLNDVEIGSGTATSDVNELVTAINNETDNTGVEASSDSGNLVLTSDSTINVTSVQVGGTGDVFTGSNNNATFDRGIELNTDLGEDIDLVDTDSDVNALNLGLTQNASTTNDVLNNTTDKQRSDVDGLSVLSRDDASDAIRTADFALQQVSGLRSELGAVQNRFESTIANLSVSAENLSAARSRIQDTDFASETAELTRAQILQQAGTSILSQANAVPQSVLGLLQ